MTYLLGIGYAAVTISGYIGFYYNMIISYCIYYFIMSLRAKLPWSDCNPKWSNSLTCAVREEGVNCSTFLDQYRELKIFKNLAKKLSIKLFYTL